jgi:hypothetical protein
MEASKTSLTIHQAATRETHGWQRLIGGTMHRRMAGRSLVPRADRPIGDTGENWYPLAATRNGPTPRHLEAA